MNDETIVVNGNIKLVIINSHCCDDITIQVWRNGEMTEVVSIFDPDDIRVAKVKS